MDENLIGVVISKLEPHRGGPMRGYIAMLAVREGYRGKGIATELVRKTLDVMIERDADEVLPSKTFCQSFTLRITQIALETEVTNTAAMKLYERLGFLKSKRLHRYYLNGNSAFRFMLLIKDNPAAFEYEEEAQSQLPTRPPSA